MPLPCIDEGCGPAILFLHGWTLRGAVFADQVARLRGRFRCLAPDLPGHGAARALSPDLDSMAGAVADLVAARGLSEVTLVGWSMGAAVGWRWLADGRAPVRAMLSVEMGPRLVNGPGWTLGLMAPPAGPAALEADWPGAARTIARAMFAQDAPAGL
ncbi:MAG: alpha/beta fold hydrolase, partial [Paracoccaceae bacterium]